MRAVSLLTIALAGLSTAAAQPAPTSAVKTKAVKAAQGTLSKTAGAPRQGSIRAQMAGLSDLISAGLRKSDPQGLPRVAVLTLEALDDDSKTHRLGRVAAELIASRLTRTPGLLQVERSRIAAVIDELDRSKAGALNPKSAASAGKLLGASAVVVGSVAAAGSDFVITARAVDTRTGRVITAADNVFPRAGLVALSEDMVEIKSKGGAAARSAVLPGWGQMYNGHTGRGLVYGALFGLTAAGAITSGVLGSQAESDYSENRPDTVGRRADANTHFQRANVLLVGLGAVWAVSVADAWITGTDHTVVQVGSTPAGGAALTFAGAF